MVTTSPPATQREPGSLEFVRLAKNFINEDLLSLTERYPITMLVATFAAGFFGFFTFFSLTISAIISSTLLMTLAVTLGISIAKNTNYWTCLWESIVEVKDALFQICNRAES